NLEMGIERLALSPHLPEQIDEGSLKLLAGCQGGFDAGRTLDRLSDNVLDHLSLLLVDLRECKEEIDDLLKFVALLPLRVLAQKLADELQPRVGEIGEDYLFLGKIVEE